MSDIFQKKLKLIDKNITELNSNTLEIKESLELLKTTTNLLNSANDMIIAQNNTINNETNTFLLGNSIEKYYKELLNRKKQISDFTVKYKDIVKEKKMQLEEESINNSDNETDFLLRKKRPEIDLQFVINKKEKLVNKGQKDLEEIKNDIEQIQENINKQKDDLEDLEDEVNDNDLNADKAGGIINSILSSETKSKMLLSAINVLLFLLIIIVIIYKFFK